MTGYGDSFYGSDWYVASQYREGTELRIGIRARIVKPVGSVPPVIDTIYTGLAERFDFLQQGIQAFALFNKITYAKSEAETENSILPSLDGVWGKLYNLPRLTGESDDHYRMRLQTYVKVLTGCGTIPNCQEVLDFLVGYPGSTRILPIWPARAIIDFNDVDAMRSARSRLSLLNSVLPGMFAAGVDYEMRLPYIDSAVCAYIQGDAELPITMKAAIRKEQELQSSIYALIARETYLPVAIVAAIRAERALNGSMKAAIQKEQILEPGIQAAILGNPELPAGILAAIRAERLLEPGIQAAILGNPELPITVKAAIAKTFEMHYSILARVGLQGELPSTIKAAIAARRDLTVGIRARITRST